MKDPFLSIIMPFHDSARTLEASARSVLTQSYAEFELLLVDDVSTDESPAIAAGLAAEDPRVRCFTLPEHGGAAGARNEGIRRAKGDYILFLDSDDFYTEGLLPEAAAAAKGGPDVVLWGLQEEYLDAKGEVTRTVEIRPTAQTLADAESVRRQVMGWEERSLYGYLWNKAYRAELIRGKQIPTQSFNEDEMFNIAVFGEVSSVTALDFIGTRYRIGRGGSLTHRQLPDYYPLAMKRVVGLMLQQKLWGLYTPRTRRTLANLYLRYVASALARNCEKAAGLTTRERRMFLQRVYASRLYAELAEHMDPDGVSLKPLASALRRKDTLMCLAIGRSLAVAKSGLPAFFDRVKGVR